MQFSYRAKQARRTESSGVIDAVDFSSAVAHLKQMGFYPLEVIPLQPADGPSQKRSPAKPLSSSGLALWARIVGQGLSAGLGLTQALQLLAEQERGRPAGQAAGCLQREVTAGMSLAEAMERMGGVFSPVAVHLVRSGESSGALEKVLQSLADRVEAEAELVARVRGALAYPLFVLAVGIATVAVLVWWVVPKLGLLFAETGQALPWTTRLLIASGRGLVWVLGAAVAAGPVLWWGIRKKGWGAVLLLWGIALLNRLPWFGLMSRQAEIARLASNLGLLLEQGLPLPRALQLTAETVSWPELKLQIQRCRREVMEGVSVSQGLRRAGVKEPLLLTILAMGEASGDLGRAFLQAGDRYQRQVDRMIKVLSALVEPVLILVVGLVVGGIVFSMLLPIFQINFSVG